MNMKLTNKRLITFYSVIVILISGCAIVETSTLTQINNTDEKPKSEDVDKFILMDRFSKNNGLNVYKNYNRSLPEIINDNDSVYIKLSMISSGCGCPSGFINRSNSKDTLIYEYNIYDGCKMECPPRVVFVKDVLANFNIIKFVSESRVIENGNFVIKPKYRYLWKNGYIPEDTIQSIPFKKPQMLWTKTFKGNCRKIQKTADHGFIICGISKSNALLIKANEFGEMQWMKTYPNKKRSGLSYVNQTFDGGYIASGYTYGKEILGEPDADFWIIKTDSLGNTLWTKTIKGPYDDYANSVIETMDSNFVFCGTSKPNISSGYDLCLIKLSNTGEKLWKRSYDNTSRDFGHFLSQNNNNFLIFGSTGNKIHPSLSDIWLIKTNNKGDTLYTKSFGGILSTSLRSLKYYGSCLGDISLSESENYSNKQLLLGTSRNTDRDSSIWILNIDTKKDSISFIISKKPENDRISCIASTRDGGYLIGGSNGLLYKIDLNGNFLWQMSFNKFNLSNINTIKTISKDEFIICGSTSTLKKDIEIMLLKIKLENEGNMLLISDNKQNQSEQVSGQSK